MCQSPGLSLVPVGHQPPHSAEKHKVVLTPARHHKVTGKQSTGRRAVRTGAWEGFLLAEKASKRQGGDLHIERRTKGRLRDAMTQMPTKGLIWERAQEPKTLGKLDQWLG